MISRGSRARFPFNRDRVSSTGRRGGAPALGDQLRRLLAILTRAASEWLAEVERQLDTLTASLAGRDPVTWTDHAAGGITGHLEVTFRARPEGEQWSSECVELEVASCGDSRDEAVAAVIEAACLYLEELERMGTRDQVLGEQRLKVHPGRPHHDEQGPMTESPEQGEALQRRALLRVSGRASAPALR